MNTLFAASTLSRFLPFFAPILKIAPICANLGGMKGEHGGTVLLPSRWNVVEFRLLAAEHSAAATDSKRPAFGCLTLIGSLEPTGRHFPAFFV